jgi:uncharacterized glyoxalase superfamily protein PhnB
LRVPDVAKLINFLHIVFDARKENVKTRPDGSIMHAELQIGDSKIMMGEPTGAYGPFPGCIYIYVPDCDHTFSKPMAAGGTSIMEPTNMPSGERYGGMVDPSGNQWWIATHMEDISEEEEEKRFKKFFEEKDQDHNPPD